MATPSRRTEEKGQRTPRSLDAYQDKDGLKGSAYCSCGALYRNKRWVHSESGTPTPNGETIVCPACRRVSDQNPAGILSLGGDYFAVHAAEINHLIDRTAQAFTARNPLARVMESLPEKGGIAVTTTDVKLAQKLGRELFKAHGGELHYIWSHGGNPVRVTWSR